MAKVTGIGGVFFITENVEKTKDWYQEHLGIESGEYGGQFEWRDLNSPDERKVTAWSPFPNDTQYFNPEQKHMVNYRVDNLDEMLENFKKQNVKILGGPESFDYGKFAWIQDPNGYRVELWEPIDGPFLSESFT